MKFRVVKLGGSLLAQPHIAARLRRWLSRQSPACHVLVVGGGEAVNWLRRLDQLHSLDARLADELAVRMMQVNSRLIHALLDSPPWIARWSSLTQWPDNEPPRLVVLDPILLCESCAGSTDLARRPADWTVTSDSLAALVADALGDAELVLLKHGLPAPDATEGCRTLDAAGWVDSYFNRATENLTCVRLVDLIDDRFPEVRW